MIIFGSNAFGWFSVSSFTLLHNIISKCDLVTSRLVSHLILFLTALHGLVSSVLLLLVCMYHGWYPVPHVLLVCMASYAWLVPGAPCVTSVHDLTTLGWCPVPHVLLVCMIWLPLAGARCPMYY